MAPGRGIHGIHEIVGMGHVRLDPGEDVPVVMVQQEGVEFPGFRTGGGIDGGRIDLALVNLRNHRFFEALLADGKASRQ